MKTSKLSIFAASMVLFVGTASADMIEFEFEDDGVTVAEGSFSFASGASGILGYDDLIDFEISIGYSGNVYTLAGIAGFNDYRWFGFDTSTNMFVESGSLCGFAGCGFVASLSAVNSTGTSGYFFTPLALVGGEFADYDLFQNRTFDAIRYTRVPEPGALALFALGLIGVGFARRRRT